jgi:hypothetical protein
MVGFPHDAVAMDGRSAHKRGNAPEKVETRAMRTFLRASRKTLRWKYAERMFTP